MLKAIGSGALLVAAVAMPLSAQGGASNEELLERRLRNCLSAGAPGAPRDSLMAAILALRSLCHTQIKRVEAVRIERVDKSFGLPEAHLSVRDRERLESERNLARRALAQEIGVAVSSFTGLAG